MTSILEQTASYIFSYVWLQPLYLSTDILQHAPLSFLAMAGQEESQSTPALIHIPESSSGLTYVGGVSSEAGAVGGVVTGVPENTLQESCTRLSTSLEENGLYKVCCGKMLCID